MVRRNLTGEDATFRGLFGLVLAVAAMDAFILLDGSTRWVVAGAAASLSGFLIATVSVGHCPVYWLFGRRRLPADKGWQD